MRARWAARDGSGWPPVTGQALAASRGPGQGPQPPDCRRVAPIVPAAAYPLPLPWPRIPLAMTRIGPPGRPAPPRPGDSVPDAATADPDVLLMLRVQQGDEEAFPALFQRYGPRVLQYVRRLVGHDARAEEITQDVFV